jgi:phage terminase large subunit-like protein
VLEELEEEDIRRVLAGTAEADALVFDSDWGSWAREGQAPAREEWRQWVMLAGRGFGKTRAGAEYVSAFARANPDASIALVGATAEEARAVMVEGRSGLLAVARADERARMRWKPSLRLLRFASGAEARLYSAANPEALRGPEHHLAWCDELAKWRRAEAAWTNLRLGLRLGTRPRAIVTTTPKPVPLLKRLLDDPETIQSGGPSWANPHISPDFLAAVEAEHGGTRTGRQELEGKLIEDVEGALWSRSLIERSRRDARLTRDALTRIVVGVDPPAGAEGTCGIVVCGLDRQGIAYVLADMSVSAALPEEWARRVGQAAEKWGAHRVVAEANNGGRMVESVLRSAEAGLPVTLVHASEGKAARAEPVAVAFENGRARLAGRFPELEDEMAGIAYRGGYEGPGRSPDRADAMVWAMTELIVKPQRGWPRVIAF